MIYEEVRKKQHYKGYKRGGHHRCNKNCKFIVISRTSSPMTSALIRGRVKFTLLKGGKIK